MVSIDIGNKQVRCIFMQEETKNRAKPIAYWFPLWNMTDKPFDKLHYEFLPVLTTVFKLRPYLGHPGFTVDLDSDSLS